MSGEHDLPVQFLRVAFQPDDWIALFLKSYVTGRVGQRIVPVALAHSERLQEWLYRENAKDGNVRQRKCSEGKADFPSSERYRRGSPHLPRRG